jgi:hypothetical protein
MGTYFVSVQRIGYTLSEFRAQCERIAAALRQSRGPTMQNQSSDVASEVQGAGEMAAPVMLVTVVLLVVIFLSIILWPLAP